MMTGKIRRGRYFISGPMLVASGNQSGDWQHPEGVFPIFINVSGEFVGTVKLYAETVDDEPTDADANHGVLATFTAPGSYILNAPVEWLKAAMTDYVSGVAVISAQASESQSKF